VLGEKKNKKNRETGWLRGGALPGAFISPGVLDGGEGFSGRTLAEAPPNPFPSSGGGRGGGCLEPSKGIFVFFLFGEAPFSFVERPSEGFAFSGSFRVSIRKILRLNKMRRRGGGRVQLGGRDDCNVGSRVSKGTFGRRKNSFLPNFRAARH